MKITRIIALLIVCLMLFVSALPMTVSAEEASDVVEPTPNITSGNAAVAPAPATKGYGIVNSFALPLGSAVSRSIATDIGELFARCRKEYFIGNFECVFARNSNSSYAAGTHWSGYCGYRFTCHTAPRLTIIFQFIIISQHFIECKWV